MTGTPSNIIEVVQAWEALDSRGRPTVAARVVLSDGAEGVCLVPSGVSTGSHEAVELRDGETRYNGRGVRGAVTNALTTLATRVHGLPPSEVDTALAATDDSPAFANIGGNSVLAVSIAAARADAAAHGMSLARYLAADQAPLLLPMPMVNIISGGAHAGGAVDVQDFLVIPVAATNFAQAIEWAASVREAAAGLALRRGYEQGVLVADEGGLGLPLKANRDALRLVADAVDAAGLSLGTQVAIAIDVAATQFYRDGRYHLSADNRVLTSDELVAELAAWCDDYPVVSLEDVLAEDDWTGWQHATAVLGKRVELVGDDLFATQGDRLQRGIQSRVGNSVLVKVNQNGLLSGTRRFVDLARTAGYRTVVSARSGETEDNWVSDIAVGWKAGQIKVGSTHRSDRTAKWNRLLQFEATEHTTFAGPWSGGRPGRDTA